MVESTFFYLFIKFYETLHVLGIYTDFYGMRLWSGKIVPSISNKYPYMGGYVFNLNLHLVFLTVILMRAYVISEGY